MLSEKDVGTQLIAILLLNLLVSQLFGLVHGAVELDTQTGLPRVSGQS